MPIETQIKISATIITLNEEENIARAIKSLNFVNEIIVVDSGSTDNTLEIAKELGAKICFNKWQGFGQQKNFAHNLASGEWILNIDADEEVSEELKNEIIKSIESKDISGYFIPRKSKYLNRWITHGGWYPNYLIRLSRKNASKWTEPNVHEELKIQGKIEYLKSDLLHYPFKSVSHQVRTNVRYAEEGALDLIRKKKSVTLLHIIFKPFGKFIETYFIKKGFLDGFAGFVISVNAAHSMFLKYVNAKLITK